MSLLRKILFWIFALIYITVCPAVILYALGIIFDPKTQTVEKTGIIYISSLPPGADVFIDGKQLADKTPLIIENLSAGSHHVMVAREDYQPWQKTLPVNRQKSTAIEKLLLIPTQWPQAKLPFSYIGLAGFDQPPFLMLRSGPLLKDVFIYRAVRFDPEKFMDPRLILETGRLFPLATENFAMENANITGITTIEGSPFVVLKIFDRRETKFLWFNALSGETKFKDITSLILGEAQNILWAANNENDLYVLGDGRLSRVDIKNNAVHPDIVKGIKNFALFRSAIYALTTDGRLMQYDHDGENPQPVLKNNPATALPALRGDVAMRVYADDLAVLLSGDGTLVLSRPPYLCAEGVTGFLFDENRRHLLIWTLSRLGYLDLQNKDGANVIWLETGGRGIRQAFWANGGDNIIFTTHKEVFITETQTFNQAQAYLVTRIAADTSVHYSDKDGVLSFLDTDGRLSAIRVMP